MKYIGVAVGLVILSAMLFFQNSQDTKIQSANPNKAFIGREFVVSNFLPINTSDSIDLPLLKDKMVYVLVSPTCPHCKNALKMLMDSNIGDTLNMPIMPIFKEKISNEKIKEMLAKEKITLPVYKVADNQVLEGIKYVPAFLYINAGKVENVIVGGVLSKKELVYLLKTLTNTKWQKDNLSMQDSACVL
jgi:glutaredoxin